MPSPMSHKPKVNIYDVKFDECMFNHVFAYIGTIHFQRADCQMRDNVLHSICQNVPMIAHMQSFEKKKTKQITKQMSQYLHRFPLYISAIAANHSGHTTTTQKLTESTEPPTLWATCPQQHF